MAVLGLADPGDGDWARLRGLQYSSLARVSRLRIAANLIAALGVVWVYFSTVHLAFLALWLAALCGSLWQTARNDKALADADRRRMSRDEVNRQSRGSVINALVWVVPLAGFAPFGTESARLELWAITAMLMTASAVLLPAVPLGNLLFAGIVGGGAFAGFACAGA